MDEYLRYGRQMIVPEFGFDSQKALKSASILVIGAGGLGCPAIAYLAGAGAGSLTIVDGDTVEQSNLHRQIIHSTARIGDYKAESARKYVEKINPFVKVTTVTEHISNGNVFQIIKVGNTKEDSGLSKDLPKEFDVILDCSDNPATRYLVNDAAVLSSTPLVSASALKTEGQLSVLNFLGGPCYRCLFPIPPPPNSVVACGDGGILGPVVGMMGVYQALEAIKVLAGMYYLENTSDDKASESNTKGSQKYQPTLTIFSALSFPPWRCVRMRGRKAGCASCDPSSPKITVQGIQSGEIDYDAFCGHVDPPRIQPEERITVNEYDENVLKKGVDHILLDVRPKAHFGICALPGSILLPWEDMKGLDKETLQQRVGMKDKVLPIYVVCRYGNDSQLGVRDLKNKLGLEQVWDIVGGLNAWSDNIDPEFPRY